MAVYGGLITLATILGTFKAPFKILSIGSLAAVPFAVAAQLVAENRCDKRVKLVESELDKLTQENRNLQQLSKQLDAVLAELDQTKSQLSEWDKAGNEALAKLHNQNILLTGLKLDNQKLIDQLKDYEETYATSLDSEIQQGIHAYKDNHKAQLEAKYRHLLEEAQEITIQAMKLPHKYKDWGEKVADRLVSQKGYILGLTKDFNYAIDEASTGWEKERDTYLAHIEVLEEKVGRLQQRLSGDLVEPEYLDCGYAIEGRIANDLAKEIWKLLGVPLSVRGYSTVDGTTTIGYGFSRAANSEVLVGDLKRHSEAFVKELGLHRITSIRKLEYGDLIVVSFRREPAIRTDNIGLLIGSAEEFLAYVTANPIRYRLIADPGTGKTPLTAVMLSEILKNGARRGNTAKGSRVEKILINVSYPGVQSSLKDSDYPLDLFLKYGTETAAVRSFNDAVEDWEYRKNDVKYASEYFQVWVWDELDNTLNSADDPASCAEKLKKILKQGGHNNVGWIVSGQSVMTKQLPGFTNDDRSLFTEIIIGIPKIRLYLNVYGKGKNGESHLAALTKNLDDIEEYVESQNKRITDDARLLRVALIADSRSPKLFFIPNLDKVDFSSINVDDMLQRARWARSQDLSGTNQIKKVIDTQNPCLERIGSQTTMPSFPPIEGGSQTTKTGHCPHCGGTSINIMRDERYRCLGCKKRFVKSKVVWK
jgi:hypothetical protein